MYTNVGIYETFLLLEDGEFRRSFLIELHKYLKDKLPKDRVDAYPKGCNIGSSSGCRNDMIHFETFCISRSMHPLVARELLRLIYGPFMNCDCEYFLDLKVTEEDPEPPRAEYVNIYGRW